MATSGSKLLSQEERRKQKELEEARKAGLVAPEVDEDGKAINPHIPQFMASAPWYLNTDKPTLKHQKNWKGGKDRDDFTWYDRGAKVFQATKYRKGACANCGSISHKTKDCMERPRVKGAKFTNKNIAPDEKVQDIDLPGFEAKRDRWNGYDEEEWAKQAENFEKIAEMRKALRRKELLEQKFKGEIAEDADVDGALEKEEDKVADEEDEGFAKVEKRVNTAGGGSTGTVRNLRIREDTAKYLLNLDVNSAYYDPKSRSMREDPNPEKDPSEKTFAGDNFVRQSGASQGFQQLNLFSIVATEKGQDVHMQAMPSQAEISHRAVLERKKALQASSTTNILEKYGNAAEIPTEDVKALKATEAYVEYDASGRVIRGQEMKAKSRYEEDVFPGNHTSVWGSWYCNGVWGYACCHQTTKNAFCTGETGKQAALDNMARMEQNMIRNTAQIEAIEDEEDVKGTLANIPPSDVWGTDPSLNVEFDREKLREAIKRQEKDASNATEDDRKRRYNSFHSAYDVSAEDMEAYRLKRSRADDPMAAIEKAKQSQRSSHDYV